MRATVNITDTRATLRGDISFYIGVIYYESHVANTYDRDCKGVLELLGKVSFLAQGDVGSDSFGNLVGEGP